MSLLYSAYFLKPRKDIEIVEKDLDENIFKSEESQWLVYNFYRDFPNDSVFEPDSFMSERVSKQVEGEVIFIFVDGMSEAFHYEHTDNGVLLRKLLLLNDGTMTIWKAAKGTPESWESDMIFSESQLNAALSSPFIEYDSKNKKERDVQEQAIFREELKTLYSKQQFMIDDVWPLCDVEGLAFAVINHYQLVLPQ